MLRDKDKIRNFDIFWNALPAVAVFIVLYLARGNPFEDDAYIFYRYAENWASGYGPVFNIGEYVEGYSSLLWTLLLTAGAYLSFDLVIFAPLLNLFIGIACLVYISYVCSFIQFARPREMSVGMPLVCALSYGFYYYGATGMDALLFSLVLLFSVITLYKCAETRSYLYALLPLFLLNIVRAEGFIYSVFFVSVMAVSVYSDRDNSSKNEFYAMLVIFAAMTLSLFGLRYSIYHEWMPATVTAKGFATYVLKTAVLNGDIQACKNFLKVILGGAVYENFLLLCGAWIPFVILFIKRGRRDMLLLLMASGIFVNIFVTIWAGGDYFPYKRHFIPVLPILIIFTAWSLDLLFREYWNGQAFRKIFISSVAFLVILSWVFIFIAPAKPQKNYLAGGDRDLALEKIGKMLRGIPGSTVLLTNMVGKLPYYAGPNVYVRDILGLTDIHNAKFGDVWGLNEGGGGVCGRTDYMYSFASPFDVFFYNSGNMHNRFISFCLNNPSSCDNYRFFTSDKLPKSYFYIVADIRHPFAKLLEDEFNAVPFPVNEDLRRFTDD